MPSLRRDEFVAVVARERAAGDDRVLAVPISIRVLSDQLTPVLAYRRLVSPDARTDPSFLLESVEGGTRAGRYSLLGSRPVVRVIVTRSRAIVRDELAGTSEDIETDDPLGLIRGLGARYRLVEPGVGDGLPGCPLGGWFGYAGYDSARYGEPVKLAEARAPRDDRGLADVEFGLYDGVIAFDNASKLVHVVGLALVGPGDDVHEAYERVVDGLESRAQMIQQHTTPLPLGRVDRAGPTRAMDSNTTRDEHRAMVERAQAYIRAGDVFQVVVGQRFERVSNADPFDVYRTLRAVNPSPYMVYMQTSGCILVASSPEILCRVRREGDGAMVVTNRPLAGTRPRGATEAEDAELERALLGDEKERAEHIMLVDLGRNDVGRVAQTGTVVLEKVMEVERYSHVMHIASTVTGVLREGLDAWDALREALPVGTISGAPKIRAMQIIDELEPVRRGPYGGGMGYVGLDGQMDVALALRTIVVPIGMRDGDRWTYHIQAAGGIVADSRADDEYAETVNKAAALGRAIELAERAFGDDARNDAGGA